MDAIHDAMDAAIVAARGADIFLSIEDSQLADSRDSDAATLISDYIDDWDGVRASDLLRRAISAPTPLRGTIRALHARGAALDFVPIARAPVLADLLEVYGHQHVNCSVPGSGWTLLHIDAQHGHSTAWADWLIAHGADRSATDTQGRTAFDIAAEYNFTPARNAVLERLRVPA